MALAWDVQSGIHVYLQSCILLRVNFKQNMEIFDRKIWDKITELREENYFIKK